MDWARTCRVCLEGGEMVSLLSGSDENNELLRDKYKYTTGIEVVETENLPTLICAECVARLLFAYKFRKQCITSNETLMGRISQLDKTTPPTSAVPDDIYNAAGFDSLSIKQENAEYMVYELPVEDVMVGLDMTMKRGRGRPRKHPDQPGDFAVSATAAHRDQDKSELNESIEEVEQSNILTSLKLERTTDAAHNFSRRCKNESETETKRKKNKKPPVIRDWFKKRDFDTAVEAEQHVLSAGNWKKVLSYKTHDGVKVKYRCIHGKYRSNECSKGLYLLYRADDTKVDMYETTSDHDNHVDMSRGLTREARDLVRRLYRDGIRKPNAIIATMQSQQIEAPVKGKLVNFLASLRARKSDAFNE